MAELTSDIVWLVEKTVTLADGSTTRALVPQVYVRVQDGDLQASGALIAGDSVNLNLTGDLTNSASIAGRTVVALTAQNIHNLGGRISGAEVGVAARGDLNNIGGAIVAGRSLQASAGRDLNLISTTRTQTNAQGSRTNMARVAGLYVTGSADGSGTLQASAGRDANLIAAAIQNQGSGDTTLAAGANLTLGTLATASANSVVWNATNRRSDSSTAEVGTTVQAQGDLRLQAGGDLNARAANVQSQGALLASAGRDIKLTAGQSSVQLDEAHQHKSKGFLSKKITTTRATLAQTTAQATTLSGQTASVLAERDISLTGSNIVSDNGTLLIAQGNLDIAAASQSTVESHFKDQKKSGLMGAGFGFTIGKQQLSTGQKNETTTAAASTVGATAGNVTITAGNTYRQSGSDVLTPAGDITIQAKDINILEARQTSQTTTEQKFKQSGLTVALSSPVISAIQTAQQMSQAAGNTGDSRMKALAGANAALSLGSAANAVQAGQGSTLNGKDGQIATGRANPDGTPQTRDATAADKVGGINVSVSIGASKSQSNSVQSSNTAAASTVQAGGNVNISATGAGKDSALTIQGSSVLAGNAVTLQADGDINLLAAQNTQEQHSTDKSSSASVGIGFALGGGQNGFTLNIGASGSRGNADGNDLGYSNTLVQADKQLTLQSGSDTVLKGAVASGKQVVADVGGSLNIESLSDTSTYASKQQSLGGSLSLCIPPFCYGASSGSVSASKGNANSNYASVTEQSGLKTGDDGFQVNVKGNTGLLGAVIESSAKAVQDGKNTLTTASLTQSDIQNKADASASSSGINLSTDMLSQGNYGLAKAALGNALNSAGESGSSSGQTRSAVSAGSVTITDEAKQQQLTGKTGQETVASLNRDTANAQTAAVKQDVQEMKQTVEAERAIKQEAVKQLTTLTDDAYRVMFKEKPQFYKVVCPTGADCSKNPELAKPVLVQGTPEQVQAELAKADKGAVLAVNGIDNPLERAAQLAMQNAEPVTVDANGQPLAKPEKPTIIYLMHYVPANNGISELMVAAYEKSLAPTLGYTNQDQAYADAIQARGNEETVSLGHSRGTIVQVNANTILADQGFTNSNLAVRGVGGAVGAQVFTDAAAKVINDKENNRNITFNYFANDPVAVGAGGNPGVLSLSEFWQVLQTSNSAHSCYGTGASGCRQVEILTPNSPQGAVQDNSNLIRFEGGKRVDANPIGR